VLVAGFPAVLGTNCWVVAPARGEQCVVIDPGIDAVSPLEDLLAEHRLHPVAVILTHGHYDHTWSVVPVCGARGIPAYIHPRDRAQLTQPGGVAGRPPGTPLLGRLDFSEPDDVRELVDGTAIELGPVRLQVAYAPGHTPGSVTFAAAGDGDDAKQLFSGDLLFAGSVGRTDLPGGSLVHHPCVSDLRWIADAPEVPPGHRPARLTRLMSGMRSARSGGCPGRADRRQG